MAIATSPASPTSSPAHPACWTALSPPSATTSAAPSASTSPACASAPRSATPAWPDLWEGIDHPADDGIYLVDLESGAAELTVSLDEIASVRPHSSMHGAINWLNHLIFSPDDAHAMFVHRWWPPGAPRYRTRFMLLRIDDASVREIWPTRASHMCWRSPTQILFSAIPVDVPDDPESRTGEMGFWMLDLTTGDAREVGRSVLPPDGHCSYRPGGRFVLMDTQPDANRVCGLLVYDEDTERVLELGRLPLPAALRWPGPLRPAPALEPRRPAGLHRLGPRRHPPNVRNRRRRGAGRLDSGGPEPCRPDPAATS